MVRYLPTFAECFINAKTIECVFQQDPNLDAQAQQVNEKLVDVLECELQEMAFLVYVHIMTTMEVKDYCTTLVCTMYTVQKQQKTPLAVFSTSCPEALTGGCFARLAS